MRTIATRNWVPDVAFGQQSGPPASAKQVSYLLALLQKAGYASFREARGAFGLTQRQAGGKFATGEASALIDQLLNSEHEADDQQAPAAATAASAAAAQRATARLEAQQVDLVRGMPAGLLAAELERRGYTVTEPT